MKKFFKAFALVLAAGAILGLSGCSSDDEGHEHTYTAEWSTNRKYHWYAATCEHTEEVKGKAEHTFETTTKEGDKCSTTVYTCSVCDYSYEVTNHKWDEGTTTAPTFIEKGVKTYTCTVCNETKTKEIAELYSTPVDAETGEAATRSSTYVYFGVFPKTVLPSTSTVTVDESTSITMGANTYYKGSDGEYYAKVTENAYLPSYSYTDGTTVESSPASSTRYFKVEPIKWRVLTTDYNGTGEALLLAEDILTSNVPYYVSTSSRTIGGATVYASNYKYSTIRAYLNGSYESDDTQTQTYADKGFLQTAFIAAAQAKIATATVDNSGESTSDATGTVSKADGTNSIFPTDYTCANTNDKIFLLSKKEVTTTDYGFAAYNVYVGDSNGTTESNRIRVTTDYAKANNAYQSTTTGYGGWWWLRSPIYFDSDFAYVVEFEGRGDLNAGVYSLHGGIVPALCISF